MPSAVTPDVSSASSACIFECSSLNSLSRPTNSLLRLGTFHMPRVAMETWAPNSLPQQRSASELRRWRAAAAHSLWVAAHVKPGQLAVLFQEAIDGGVISGAVQPWPPAHCLFLENLLG